MYDLSIFSEQGLKRIFQGEVLPVKRTSGVVHHFRVVGYCLEDESTGNQVVEASRVFPDSRGVYSASAIVQGVKRAKLSNFFPCGWSRAQVIQAVTEAYANRQPREWETHGRFFEGVSNSGIKIVMELDQSERVLDVILRRSGRNNAKRQALWLIEQGKVRKSKHVCGVCHSIKASICPKGHNLPTDMLTVRQLARLLVRRINWRLRH